MYVSAIELLVRKFERVLAITRFLCRNIKFVLLRTKCKSHWQTQESKALFEVSYASYALVYSKETVNFMISNLNYAFVCL